MSEIRIALVMGGGVSLGSFSSGALVEALRLLEGHTARLPAKVDVVTGASAGSMTLGLAMFHLFQGSSLDDMKAAMELAWVKTIEFDRLRESRVADRSPALFSDRVVRDIAETILRFREWRDRPPHPLFANGALASFAVSNLNGIPVRTEGQLIRQAAAGGARPTGAKSPFADAVQTTFHDDMVRFRLVRDQSAVGPAPKGFHDLVPWSPGAEEPTPWTFFREAAIASGAFPAAFPPVRLYRTRGEYGELWPDELTSGRFPFDYVDGGVFRNEPLREAIHLAGIRDRGWEGERAFLFIDPNVSGTKEAYTLPHNLPAKLERELRDDGHERAARVVAPDYMDRLMGALGRLGGAVASQAAFRDWLKAARVNSQVEWRDALEGIVDDLVPREGSQAEERLNDLLERIYRERAIRRLATDETPPSNAEIRARIEADLARRTEEGGEVTFSTRLRLLVDLVANLREKRKLNLVAITPSSVPGGGTIPLSGNFLSNFGGFFQEEFRRYDFAVGEHLAGMVLTAPIGDGDPAKRLIAEHAPVPPLPPSPGRDPSYRDLDATIQGNFEGLVRRHTHAFLGKIGIPGIIRGTVANKIRGKLRSGLLAEVPGTRAPVVVEVMGSGSLRLKANLMADDARPGDDDVIRTVVYVRRVDKGGKEFWLEGPHVVEGGTNHARLTVLERRFLGSRPVGSITLGGGGRGWWGAIRAVSAPVVRVAWDGSQDQVTLAPGQVADGPIAHPLVREYPG